MTSFLDNLNLRPQERRLVILVAVVFFVVLNVWLVWPHFGDWNRIQAQKLKAERTLREYQDEIAKIPVYQAKLAELETLGTTVASDEQDLELELIRTVQRLALVNGLSIEREGSGPSSNTKTNQFFDEKIRSIKFQAGDDELVNFLISLASTNSLIRVRDLQVSPGPSGTNLFGDITLVASYQKNLPTISAAPSVAPAPSPNPIPNPRALPSSSTQTKATAPTTQTNPTPISSPTAKK